MIDYNMINKADISFIIGSKINQLKRLTEKRNRLNAEILQKLNEIERLKKTQLK